MGTKQHWPAMRYGPGGKQGVFESAGDVPQGWVAHPSLVVDEASMRRRVDSNADHYQSIRELQNAYAAGEVTLAEIRAAEAQREKPRASLLLWVEDTERQLAASEEDGETLTREAAVALLQEAGVDIDDLSTDEEIQQALLDLEG